MHAGAGERMNASSTRLTLASLSALHGLLIIAGIVGRTGSWRVVAIGAGALGLLAVVHGALRGRARAPLIITAIVLSAGLAAAGIVQQSDALIGAGGLGLVLILLALLTPAWTAPSMHAPAVPMRDGAGKGEEVLELLRRIERNTVLSDHARRVVHREREVDVIREAIEAEIQRGRFSVAVSLCTEMAEVFGDREGAEAYRMRIAAAQESHEAQQVTAGLEALDRCLTQRDWAGVYREAARLRRLFPEAPMLHDLDARIAAARQAHRRALESTLGQALQADDVDRAMDTLRELDRFLDREDAARLAPLVQDLVARHRERLGVRFKSAVSEHRWSEAIRAGDVIVSEYPNTKMAEEVRGMLQVLRVRASQMAAEGGT